MDFTVSPGTHAMRTSQISEYLVKAEEGEIFFWVGKKREALWRKEGALKESWNRRTLCPIPWGTPSLPLFYLDLSIVTGWRDGGGLLNGKKSAHLPCTAVGGFFFMSLFFPVLLMYIFSSCLQVTVTHISVRARDSARGLWGGRAHGWRWPNFSRLMSNASSLFSHFKIYEPHLSQKEQRRVIFQECFHFTNSEVPRNNFFKYT